MKKILIVEDNSDVLKLLGMILKTEDREIILSETGEEALEVSRTAHPDLVILDIMLPGRFDGYDVARSLKKNPETAGCAIVVMTAKAQEEDKEKAFEVGADDFIRKPFDIEDLKSKVARFLRKEKNQKS